MKLLKDTPFEVAWVAWKVRQETPCLTIVVKGSFDIVPEGPCPISHVQSLPTGDVHYDNDVARSVRYESDLAYVKSQGECFVAGSCYAPKEEATPNLLAAFKVGPVVKKLAVIGNRYFKGIVGGPTEPEPFTVMPLCWERCFGGTTSKENPVGLGMDKSLLDGKVIVRLPNIEDPVDMMRGRRHRPHTIGAFPLPRTWPQRVALAGTYDSRWRQTRWPWLPDDFDWGYFSAAPIDQRIRGFFRGNEEISLLNLNADHPMVRCRLPGEKVRVFLHVAATDVLKRLTPELDTITVDTDANKVLCLWRAVTDIPSVGLKELDHLFVCSETGSDKKRDYRSWFERCLAKNAREETAFEPESAPETSIHDAEQGPKDRPIELEAITADDFPSVGVELGAPVSAVYLEPAPTQLLPELIPTQLLPEQPATTRTDLAPLDLSEPSSLMLRQVLPEPLPLSSPVTASGLNAQELSELSTLVVDLDELYGDDESDRATTVDDTLFMVPFDFEIEFTDPAAFEEEDWSTHPTSKFVEALTTSVQLEAASDTHTTKRKKHKSVVGEDTWLMSIDEVSAALDRGEPIGADLSTVIIDAADGDPTKDVTLSETQQFDIDDGPTEDVLSPETQQLDLDEDPTTEVPLQFAARFADTNVEMNAFTGTPLDSKLDEATSPDDSTAIAPPQWAGVPLEEAKTRLVAKSVAESEAKKKRDEVIAAIAAGKGCVGWDLEGLDLSGLDLAGGNFRHAVLSGADLRNVSFDGADLTGATLEGADLREATFTQANLRNADLSEVQASHIELVDTRLDDATLIDANLYAATCIDVRFDRAELGGADVQKARFERCHLDGADFAEARLDGSTMIESSLVDADLSGGVSARGIAVEGCDLRRLRADDGGDFRGAIFRSSKIHDGRFQASRFEGANFSLSDLGRADFTGARLVRAKLLGCRLRRARFDGAKLVSAEFGKSDLHQARFEGANLQYADLRGCNLYGAELLDADTTGARFELAVVTGTKLE